MGFFGCGLDNILILPSPEKVDNRISRDSVAFFLPAGYFSNQAAGKLRGFDIYYKFYPEGANYHISSFQKSVEKDFEALKGVFDNVSEFNNRGFYKINLSSTVYSGKPVFKLNKEWVDSKLPLYFEINFGELRKDVPGEAFITVKNGNTSSSVILEKKNIYRSHIDKGEYVGFSKSIKKSNSLDKQKRPIDLKHINEDFFTKDIAPKYNLAIFVMGVGIIVDDAYSVLINLGDLSGFSLSN
ncbi:hypothetical protein LRB59_03705 [Borreliella burgdorferi]|uniref:Uncharacterized protein n=1 Tax=Borreliella burgdorferi 118a TaxID=476210 RepID=A0A7U8EZF0_BORBG|nr:hypothetical protein [Borreliella burgdorferi]EEC22206.1 conserved hypothetical protein [Borreliella burgdorferi 156a]EEE18903.1 conserved hypothetical protein [Borreliella burgdorferi 72a]EEG98997.1 conserved hypothetical protein [Borreliella burgdorferi 118a]MCD2330655.1 hypothetical protein [Borreliella burgdorferi]MCD2374616.1 hypothetical protein [Borreliella burgdorferi]